MLVTYYWFKMTGNLSWKDAGKLNTALMLNVCLKIWITIQLVYLTCSTVFQHIDSAQLEWTGLTCQEGHRKLPSAMLASEPSGTVSGPYASSPSRSYQATRISTVSGLPSCWSFLMYLFCNTQPKKNPGSAFWLCWRLKATVPLKVFHSSLKTTSAKAHTTGPVTNRMDW